MDLRPDRNEAARRKDGSDGQEDRRCRKGRTGFPVMISQSGHLNYLAASDVACGASFVAPQVGADQLVDDRLIVSRGVGDLFIIALAHHDLIGDGDVGGVAGVTVCLMWSSALPSDDLLALIANGMVGGQVLVDGCHVLRVRHSVMVDGLVGDRPVVGVRLLFALRAVLRRRVGNRFPWNHRLHGFGLESASVWWPMP